jgi:hypothetical protein
MLSPHIIIGGQSNVCWLCVDIALKLGLQVSGTYPKGKATLPEHLKDVSTLVPSDTASYSKANLSNLIEANALLLITVDKTIDKEHKALLKTAENERIPHLIVDINDHLSATASRVEWWSNEYKIEKVFVKAAFDYEKPDRTEKFLRKLFMKKK